MSLEQLMEMVKKTTDGIAEYQKLSDERYEELKAGAKPDEALIERMAALEEQMKNTDEIKAASDQLKERLDALEAQKQRTGAGDEDIGPYTTIGEQLQDVWKAAVHDDRDAATKLRSVKAGTGLNEGTPSQGGFLVQQDSVNELIKRTYEIGAVASRVRRIAISGNSNGLKIPGVNETSRADGSRYGGIQTYWTDEARTKTASLPAFRMIELNLHKLVGLVYATDELLQDTVALQSFIMQIFPEEINYEVENRILRGTGAGQPLGILNSGARVAVGAEVGQAATTIEAENVMNMYSRMWARSRPNAVWFINQDIELQLMTMTINVGTGGIPVYMPAGGVSGAQYASLFGRPVIAVEYCSTLGTEGDIMFLDLSQYLMIDKGGIQTASSMHVRFVNDEQVFRFVYRVDGQPLWNAPLTPANGTNTQSPFITLETR